MADQAGDAHGRGARGRRLNRVRLGQADALGVRGKAHIFQELGESGAFVERSWEIGAIAKVDGGQGGSSARGAFLVTVRSAVQREPEPRPVPAVLTEQRPSSFEDQVELV